MPYKDIEQEKQYQKQRRLHHKALGICVHCDRKAIPRMSHCNLCLYQQSLCHKRNYQINANKIIHKAMERKKHLEFEGKCNNCGILLLEGEGKYCVNCAFTKKHLGIKGVLNEAYYCSITSKP